MTLTTLSLSRCEPVLHMSTYCLIVVLAVLQCMVSRLSYAEDSVLSEVDRILEEKSLKKLRFVQRSGDTVIKAFQTDGCSGGMSESWQRIADTLPVFAEEYGEKPPWENCCIQHDRAYWQGMAIDGFSKRLKADRAMRNCVIKRGKALAPALAHQYELSEKYVVQLFISAANLMYFAVRIGGKPCTPLPWRWGYGWPECPIWLNDEYSEDSRP